MAAGNIIQGVRWLRDAAGQLVGYRNPITDKDEEVNLAAVQSLVSGYGIPLKASLPPVSIFGDSITAQSTSTTATQSTKQSYGYITWALALSGQRASFQPAGNFGVSGDTTTQMVARLATAAAYPAKVRVVLGGTNDVSADVAFSTITANLETIYERFLANGELVIAIPITARSLTSTTARQLLIARVNSWIRAYVAATPGMFLADPSPRYTDQSSAAAAPLSGMTSDGQHPTPTGAYWIGRAVADVLTAILPAYPATFTNPADVYDATANPGGNLLANGCLSGTSGTGGAGVTGVSIPTSWTVSRLSGTGSITPTAQARADGRPGFECVLTASLATQTAAETWALTQTVNAGGSTYAAGDQVYLECEVAVSGTITNLLALQASFIDNDGVTSFSVGDMFSPGQAMPTETGYTMFLRTPVRTVAVYAGSGTQRLIARIQLVFDATVSAGGVITVRNVALRKVVTA